MKYKYVLNFILWLFFCSFSAIWLYTRPIQLSFDFTAERNCLLQVYSSSFGGFENRNTYKETVTPWKRKYEFLLPRQTRYICISPGKQEGNRIVIRNLTLIRNKIFQNSTEYPDGRILKPVRDIVPDGDGFKVTGDQPELEVASEFIHPRKPSIRKLSLFVILFLLGSLAVFQIRMDDLNNFGKWSVRQMEQIKKYCRENSFFLIYVAGCLIILFGYEMFHMPITGDDDWYLMRLFEQYNNSMPGVFHTVAYSSLQDNFISHGRWSAAVLVAIYSGFNPVLSQLWCLICMSVVFLLLSEKLSLPPAGRYLLFPMFIANPAFYAYFQFLMTNNIFGMLYLIAFFIAVFGSHWNDWRIKTLAVFAALFAVSYVQTMILLFPLWFLLSKMSDLLENRIDYKKAFIELLQLCGFCLLVLAGYVLTLKYTLWLFEMKWEYLGDYLQKPDSLNAVKVFAVELLQKIRFIYSGLLGGYIIPGHQLVILLMSAPIIGRLIWKKRSLLDIVMMIAALAGILILPFSLDIVSFNTSIPFRSMVVLPILMTGLCILGWRALADCPKMRIAAGLLILYIGVMYGIRLNQTAYTAKFRYDQDRSVLQSIKDRCYQIPEFAASVNEKKKIPMAAIGHLLHPKNCYFPMWGDSMLNRSPEPAVIINLHFLGETYFYPVSTAKMKQVFTTAMKMPSWPAKDSVRYENGIIIVKLSGFTDENCKQYGFPFCPVTEDNSIFVAEKLPVKIKPVWTLESRSLDSVKSCPVVFSGSAFTLHLSDRHSLHTKAVKADPKKTYYMQLKIRNSPENGILRLGFSDSTRYGDEIVAKINIVQGKIIRTFGRTNRMLIQIGNDGVVMRIPGQYLEGPVSISFEDFPGKEQRIEKLVIYEFDGEENLLNP